MDLHDREDADRLRALAWVRDGLQPVEGRLFRTLWEKARHQETDRVFRLLISKPWVQDDVTPVETDVVGRLIEICYGSDDCSTELPQVLKMPFLDTVERADLDVVQFLLMLPSSDRGVLLSHVAQAGGITDDHLRSTLTLGALERQYPDLAAALRLLPWVGDGIDTSEEETVELLGTVARRFHSIIGMPFLQSWDSLDAAVLRAFLSISRVSGENYLRQVIQHPSLASGITDEQTNVLAVLNRVTLHPDLFEVLLDPAQTLVEERSITLPLAGEVRLSVIRLGVRTAPGSRTMDLLEQAVRSQEEFMGVAFPQNHAIVLVADVHRFGGTGGRDAIIVTNYPEHRGVIAHEVAHTYWAWGPGWVVEGGASFLDVISHRAYDGTPLPTRELPCTLFSTLAELERPGLGWEAIFASGCDYFLGRGIVRELYNRLGDEAFRPGYGRFYLAVRDDLYSNVCPGDDRYACYLRESFTEGATPEQAAIVEDVLNRRYYGSP